MSPAYIWLHSNYCRIQISPQGPHKSDQTGLLVASQWPLHRLSCLPLCRFFFCSECCSPVFPGWNLSSWKPSSNDCSPMEPSLVLPRSCTHSFLTTGVLLALATSVTYSRLSDSWGQRSSPPYMFILYLLIKKSCGCQLCASHCADRGEEVALSKYWLNLMLLKWASASW